MCIETASDHGLLTERAHQLLLQPCVDARAVELMRALKCLDHLASFQAIDADGTVVRRFGPFRFLIAEGRV